MMTRTIQLVVVGALFLSASPAEPCTDAGRYGGEWTTEDLCRFGLVATLPVFDSMLIGISADGAQVFGGLDDDWYLFGTMGLRIWL